MNKGLVALRKVSLNLGVTSSAGTSFAPTDKLLKNIQSNPAKWLALALSRSMKPANLGEADQFLRLENFDDAALHPQVLELRKAWGLADLAASAPEPVKAAEAPPIAPPDQKPNITVFNFDMLALKKNALDAISQVKSLAAKLSDTFEKRVAGELAKLSGIRALVLGEFAGLYKPDEEAAVKEIDRIIALKRQEADQISALISDLIKLPEYVQKCLAEQRPPFRASFLEEGFLNTAHMDLENGMIKVLEAIEQFGAGVNAQIQALQKNLDEMVKDPSMKATFLPAFNKLATLPAASLNDEIAGLQKALEDCQARLSVPLPAAPAMGSPLLPRYRNEVDAVLSDLGNQIFQLTKMWKEGLLSEIEGIQTMVNNISSNGLGLISEDDLAGPKSKAKELADSAKAIHLNLIHLAVFADKISCFAVSNEQVALAGPLSAGTAASFNSAQALINALEGVQTRLEQLAKRVLTLKLAIIQERDNLDKKVSSASLSTDDLTQNLNSLSRAAFNYPASLISPIKSLEAGLAGAANIMEADLARLSIKKSVAPPPAIEPAKAASAEPAPAVPAAPAPVVVEPPTEKQAVLEASLKPVGFADDKGNKLRDFAEYLIALDEAVFNDPALYNVGVIWPMETAKLFSNPDLQVAGESYGSITAKLADMVAKKAGKEVIISELVDTLEFLEAEGHKELEPANRALRNFVG